MSQRPHHRATWFDDNGRNSRSHSERRDQPDRWRPHQRSWSSRGWRPGNSYGDFRNSEPFYYRPQDHSNQEHSHQRRVDLRYSGREVHVASRSPLPSNGRSVDHKFPSSEYPGTSVLSESTARTGSEIEQFPASRQVPKVVTRPQRAPITKNSHRQVTYSEANDLQVNISDSGSKNNASKPVVSEQKQSSEICYKNSSLSDELQREKVVPQKKPRTFVRSSDQQLNTTNDLREHIVMETEFCEPAIKKENTDTNNIMINKGLGNSSEIEGGQMLHDSKSSKEFNSLNQPCNSNETKQFQITERLQITAPAEASSRYSESSIMIVETGDGESVGNCADIGDDMNKFKQVAYDKTPESYSSSHREDDGVVPLVVDTNHSNIGYEIPKVTVDDREESVVDNVQEMETTNVDLSDDDWLFEEELEEIGLIIESAADSDNPIDSAQPAAPPEARDSQDNLSSQDLNIRKVEDTQQVRSTGNQSIESREIIISHNSQRENNLREDEEAKNVRELIGNNSDDPHIDNIESEVVVRNEESEKVGACVCLNTTNKDTAKNPNVFEEKLNTKQLYSPGKEENMQHDLLSSPLQPQSDSLTSATSRMPIPGVETSNCRPFFDSNTCNPSHRSKSDEWITNPERKSDACISQSKHELGACIPRPQPELDAGDSKPQPELDVGDSKPQPELDVGDSKPQPELDVGDSKPQPELDVGDSKPQPQLDVGGSKPQPKLDVGGSKPQPELDVGDSKPQAELNVGGSKPLPELDVHNSRTRPESNAFSPRHQPKLNTSSVRPTPELITCCSTTQPDLESYNIGLHTKSNPSSPKPQPDSAANNIRRESNSNDDCPKSQLDTDILCLRPTLLTPISGTQSESIARSPCPETDLRSYTVQQHDSINYSTKSQPDSNVRSKRTDFDLEKFLFTQQPKKEKCLSLSQPDSEVYNSRLQTYSNGNIPIPRRGLNENSPKLLPDSNGYSQRPLPDSNEYNPRSLPDTNGCSPRSQLDSNTLSSGPQTNWNARSGIQQFNLKAGCPESELNASAAESEQDLTMSIDKSQLDLNAPVTKQRFNLNAHTPELMEQSVRQQLIQENVISRYQFRADRNRISYSTIQSSLAPVRTQRVQMQGHVIINPNDGSVTHYTRMERVVVHADVGSFHASLKTEEQNHEEETRVPKGESSPKQAKWNLRPRRLRSSQIAAQNEQLPASSGSNLPALAHKTRGSLAVRKRRLSRVSPPPRKRHSAAAERVPDTIAESTQQPQKQEKVSDAAEPTDEAMETVGEETKEAPEATTFKTEENRKRTRAQSCDDGVPAQYEVERILAKRRRKGKVEYLLKWLGFGDEDNSWVPRAKLDCPDLLEAYEANYKSRRRRRSERPRQKLLRLQTSTKKESRNAGDSQKVDELERYEESPVAAKDVEKDRCGTKMEEETLRNRISRSNKSFRIRNTRVVENVSIPINKEVNFCKSEDGDEVCTTSEEAHEGVIVEEEEDSQNQNNKSKNCSTLNPAVAKGVDEAEVRASVDGTSIVRVAITDIKASSCSTKTFENGTAGFPSANMSRRIPNTGGEETTNVHCAPSNYNMDSQTTGSDVTRIVDVTKAASPLRTHNDGGAGNKTSGVQAGSDKQVPDMAREELERQSETADNLPTEMNPLEEDFETESTTVQMQNDCNVPEQHSEENHSYATYSESSYECIGSQEIASDEESNDASDSETSTEEPDANKRKRTKYIRDKSLVFPSGSLGWRGDSDSSSHDFASQPMPSYRVRVHHTVASKEVLVVSAGNETEGRSLSHGDRSGCSRSRCRNSIAIYDAGAKEEDEERSNTNFIDAHVTNTQDRDEGSGNESVDSWKSHGSRRRTSKYKDIGTSPIVLREPTKMSFLINDVSRDVSCTPYDLKREASFPGYPLRSEWGRREVNSFRTAQNVPREYFEPHTSIQSHEPAYAVLQCPCLCTSGSTCSQRRAVCHAPIPRGPPADELNARSRTSFREAAPRRFPSQRSSPADCVVQCRDVLQTVNEEDLPRLLNQRNSTPFSFAEDTLHQSYEEPTRYAPKWPYAERRILDPISPRSTNQGDVPHRFQRRNATVPSSNRDNNPNNENENANLSQYRNLYYLCARCNGYHPLNNTFGGGPPCQNASTYKETPRVSSRQYMTQPFRTETSTARRLWNEPVLRERCVPECDHQRTFQYNTEEYHGGRGDHNGPSSSSSSQWTLFPSSSQTREGYHSFHEPSPHSLHQELPNSQDHVQCPRNGNRYPEETPRPTYEQGNLPVKDNYLDQRTYHQTPPNVGGYTPPPLHRRYASAPALNRSRSPLQQEADGEAFVLTPEGGDELEPLRRRSSPCLCPACNRPPTREKERVNPMSWTNSLRATNGVRGSGENHEMRTD